MSRLILCFAALVFVSAACGDDDTSVPSSGETSVSSSTTQATSTTTEPTSTSSTTAPADAVELTSSCQADGFTIGYPGDWEAVSQCGQFGPVPLEEPTPDSDDRTGVVSAFVDPVPFDQVVAPTGEERSRATTTIDGRRAVRIETVTSGEGLYPEGIDAVRWVVDLSAGPEDEPRTLFVDAYDLFDDVDFDRATRVLDAMARSVDIEGRQPVDGEQVVARYAGGGIPVTIAAAGAASTPATCLRIVEPEDVDPGIACVEAVEEADGIALTSLTGPSGPLTAGIVGPDVWAVTMEASGEQVSFLPVPYPARDSLAFAFPIDPAEITAISLRADDGTVLAEPNVSDARRPAD